jgi:hypothetical protein
MTKKRDKPFHLDMSFDEALKRFAQTDARELPAPKKTTRNNQKRKRRAHPVDFPSPLSPSPKP